MATPAVYRTRFLREKEDGTNGNPIENPMVDDPYLSETGGLSKMARIKDFGRKKIDYTDADHPLPGKTLIFRYRTDGGQVLTADGRKFAGAEGGSAPSIVRQEPIHTNTFAVKYLPRPISSPTPLFYHPAC